MRRYVSPRCRATMQPPGRRQRRGWRQDRSCAGN